MCTLGRCRVAHDAASEVRVNATGFRKGRSGCGVDRNGDEVVVRDVDGLGGGVLSCRNNAHRHLGPFTVMLVARAKGRWRRTTVEKRHIFIARSLEKI